MKIIGNNKDYWWWAALADGIDEKVVYDARGAEVFNESDMYFSRTDDSMVCFEIGFHTYCYKAVLNDSGNLDHYEFVVEDISEDKVSEHPINVYRFFTWTFPWIFRGKPSIDIVKEQLVVHKKKIKDKRAKVEKINAILKSSKVTGMLPAEVVAQNVYDYISWCNGHPSKIQEPGNKTKIQNAGFDLKTSFRNVK